MSTYAVELRGLTKRFGALLANDGIQLRVRAGTVHAVIGENGAGKSTAMKMLYGMLDPDAGEIVVDGQVRRWRTPSDAIAAGIGMVHQHFMLAGPHTALENVLVTESAAAESSAVRRWFRPLERSKVRSKLEELSRRYGLAVDWELPVEQLSVGVQQRIEILKALYRDARILILDEPTAVLTPQEADVLFENFRKLAAQGKTIIIITHKLREVRALASDVTVFRAGRSVAEVAAAETSEQQLADLMVGRSVSLSVAPPPEPQLGDVVLELEGLRLDAADASAPRPLLDGLNLQLRAGEVLGIAGVEGNGQSDLLDLLVRPQDFRGRASGRARLLGEDLAALDTRRARDRGLAVIPANRLREGLLLERRLTENFLLGFQRSPRFLRRGRPRRIDASALRAAAIRGIEAYDVRPRDPDAIAGRLSGGNQQKVIIARELSELDARELSELDARELGELDAREPSSGVAIRLLIAAQPTRGVDVGAIELIHQRILEARARGVAVLLVSSELSEVMALSDRVLVLYEGRVAGEFARQRASGVAAYDEGELGLRMGGAGA